jgi:hypothetical protein
VFQLAHWWGINPFELEERPLSDIQELLYQANEIHEEEERWRQQTKYSR